MKKVMLLVVLVLVACEDYPNVTKVCVNYLNRDAHCGTGFFIDGDRLITARHITDQARNNVLTLVGPGPNETTYKFEYFNDLDVVEAELDGDIAESYFDICDSIIVGAPVDMVARRGRFRDVEVIKGTVLFYTPDYIILQNAVEPGFSGGPIVDFERRCVIGSIIGTQEDRAVAVNLTSIL